MNTNNHLFTVFTPTFNRADLLPKLYKSLLDQTYKDFKWLIIADGSTDGTTELVQEWLKEKRIDIEYIWQENQGKTYILRQAFLNCDTKYIVDIDDDDTVTSDCLEIFAREWESLKGSGKNRIGAIRALTVDLNKNVVGGENRVIGNPPIDSSYLEMRIVNKGMYENLTCWDVACIKGADIFGFDSCWLGERVSFVSESVFWCRFSRFFKTRYIFYPLRLYSYTPNSLMRSTHKEKRKYINSSYSYLLMLNENIDYFWNNPSLFLRILCAYLSYMMALKIVSYSKAVSFLNNKWLRKLSYFVYPVILVVSSKMTL